MATMRTLPKALDELKAKDPHCPITIARLRSWAKEGKFLTVKIGTGKNCLCNMESLEAFLSGKTAQ